MVVYILWPDNSKMSVLIFFKSFHPFMTRWAASLVAWKTPITSFKRILSYLAASDLDTADQSVALCPRLAPSSCFFFISVACVLCCRLALERADSPSRAVDMLGRLLQGHGQGGSCTEHISSWTYQNSFLIAGQSEAWVFETAGRHWAAEQIKSRICSKYFSFISFYLCLQLI